MNWFLLVLVWNWALLMFHKFNLIKITILFQIQTGVGGTLRGRGDCSFRQDFCGGIHHRRPYPRHPRASRVPKGHLVQHHRSACQQRCHRRRLSSRDTVNYSEGEIFLSFFLVFKTLQESCLCTWCVYRGSLPKRQRRTRRELSQTGGFGRRCARASSRANRKRMMDAWIFEVVVQFHCKMVELLVHLYVEGTKPAYIVRKTALRE